MSDMKHFTHADTALLDEYTWQLDKVAKEMGRTNSPEDRVDWNAVNEKLKEWWKEKGYIFP